DPRRRDLRLSRPDHVPAGTRREVRRHQGGLQQLHLHRPARRRDRSRDTALIMNSFTGQFLRRGDEGFAAAAVSRVCNQRRPDQLPAGVLRAADAADVAAGMRLARAEGWRVAVRSGGHSWAAWSMREDTLLIDLAAFTGLSYDETTGTVTAGPAVRGGLGLDPYLAARGPFFAGRHSPPLRP